MDESEHRIEPSMRELCKSHNLVLGPDGKCVLCKRPATPLFSVRQETETLISKIFTGLLGVCLVIAASALVYAYTLDPGYTGPRWRGGAARGHIASTTQLKSTAQTASQTAPRAPDAAEKPAARQPDPNPLSASQRLAALGPKVDVTMYSAPWCSICARARDFLNARNVSLTEYDIDRDSAASQRLGKLNPARSVPTFELAGKTYVGFNPWDLEDALRAVREQRYSARAP